MIKMISCAAALSLVSLAATASTMSSSFDADAEGWTLIGGGLLTHQSTGGNPGGYLQSTDSTGGLMTLVAPASYSGAPVQDGGTLSFDFIEEVNPDVNFFSAGTVSLSGGGFVAERDLIPGDPGNSWVTYSAGLNAADWGQPDAVWDAILGNLTGIAINVESGNNVTEIVGFDNFRISTTSAPVIPLPASLPLLLGGLGLVGVVARRRHV